MPALIGLASEEDLQRTRNDLPKRVSRKLMTCLAGTLRPKGLPDGAVSCQRRARDKPGRQTRPRLTVAGVMIPAARSRACHRKMASLPPQLAQH
jgi:hypothetical protein